ncbi:MAG: DUF4364 family protein [Ruminococcus sp.]|nr:DUF4364 family protein [Ruminococcus sp.]
MFRYPDIKPEVFNPREVYEVKLLMTYFLNQTGKPCTYMQLLEIFTGEEIVDYFLFIEALKELIDTGVLIKRERDGTAEYLLSDEGRMGAESFKKLVPRSVRDRILASGLRLFARQKAEQSVSTEITEDGTGCKVSCTVSDGGVTLMQLSLYAPDREQAEHICRKMKANPAELYGRVLDFVVCADDLPEAPFSEYSE